MAELADAQDLGSCAARRVGSTPTTRTSSLQATYRLQRAFSFLGIAHHHHRSKDRFPQPFRQMIGLKQSVLLAHPMKIPQLRQGTFLRAQTGRIKPPGPPADPPESLGAMSCLCQSFWTNRARMALSTARIITPTSAKMASHILATPSATSSRQPSLTPMAKTMFW